MNHEEADYLAGVLTEFRSLIVIAGTAGIGKTTFAKGICGDRLFCDFQRRMTGGVDAIRNHVALSPGVFRDYGVVIDGLDMIVPDRRYETRNVELGAICRDVKRMAVENTTVAIVTCGVTRELFSRCDHRPHLNDLRSSGDIEETADSVILLHRPDYFDPEDRPGEMEVIIAKSRSFGRRLITLQRTTTCGEGFGL